MFLVPIICLLKIILILLKFRSLKQSLIGIVLLFLPIHFDAVQYDIERVKRAMDAKPNIWNPILHREK
ncbi:unnamed protein product [Arabidopsis halleri]